MMPNTTRYDAHRGTLCFIPKQVASVKWHKYETIFLFVSGNNNDFALSYFAF